MTYLDLFNIISKPWASAKEIKMIGACGRDKASKIRNDINELIKSNGKRLPSGKTKVVPMTKVIEYFDLDTNYITNMAKQEKDITFFGFVN